MIFYLTNDCHIPSSFSEGPKKVLSHKEKKELKKKKKLDEGLSNSVK